MTTLRVSLYAISCSLQFLKYLTLSKCSYSKLALHQWGKSYKEECILQTCYKPKLLPQRNYSVKMASTKKSELFSSFTTPQLTCILHDVVPPLSSSSHKGLAGRIGVVGGSLEYTGAPYFAAMTALKMGADISHVFCTREAALPIKSYSPELIVHPILDCGDPLLELENWLPRLHALILGPGLGRNPEVFITLGQVIEAAKDRGLAIVIDADALFYLNDHYDIIKGYSNALLTPNCMEMARLYRSVIRVDIKPDNIQPYHVKEVAKHLGVTIACKGAVDIIASKDCLVLCDVVGSLRRCGGQGDLLSGAAALFMHWCNLPGKNNSQSPVVPPLILAAWGAAALTKKASSLAFLQGGRGSLTSDILSIIPQAFALLFEKKEEDEV